MSRYNSLAFAARLGDLLAEARAELDPAEFDDLIALTANAVAAHVAARLEELHYYGGEDD